MLLLHPAERDGPVEPAFDDVVDDAVDDDHREEDGIGADGQRDLLLSFQHEIEDQVEPAEDDVEGEDRRPRAGDHADHPRASLGRLAAPDGVGDGAGVDHDHQDVEQRAHQRQRPVERGVDVVVQPEIRDPGREHHRGDVIEGQRRRPVVEPPRVPVAEDRDSVLAEEGRQQHPPEVRDGPGDEVCGIDRGDGQLYRPVVDPPEDQPSEDIGNQHGEERAADPHEEAEDKEGHLLAVALRILPDMRDDEVLHDPPAVDLDRRDIGPRREGVRSTGTPSHR